jgi:hypothetical protein
MSSCRSQVDLILVKVSQKNSQSTSCLSGVTGKVSRQVENNNRAIIQDQF